MIRLKFRTGARVRGRPRETRAKPVPLEDIIVIWPGGRLGVSFGCAGVVQIQ